MTHIATPGPVLLGIGPPWDEPEHGNLPNGTLWLDLSVTPPQLRVRLVGERLMGRPIGQNDATVRQILAPILAAITDLNTEIAAIKARLDILEAR